LKNSTPFGIENANIGHFGDKHQKKLKSSNQMSSNLYNRYQEALREVSKPAAFVDLDFFDHNVRQVLERAGNKPIRVASKSIRCQALLDRVLQSHDRYQGVMAYHAREAVFLSRHGFDDILIAYPSCDSSDLDAVAEEVALGKRLTLMVDSPEHIALANRAAKAKKVQLPLCIDVDMSTKFPGLHFGVQRSGIRSAAQAKALFEVIQQHNALRLDGIMGYEAQLAGLGDNMPGQFIKNQVIRLLQNRALSKVRALRAEVVASIGIENLRFVNAGGTGSLETSSEEAVVTEVTAGSAFYAPAMFDGYSQFRHQPAAGFALEITRQPEPHIYTCYGGGFVASGAAGKAKLPAPYLPKGAALLPNEGAGEVQTPVFYQGPQPLKIGDPVFFRHAKAGELCEHFRDLYLIKEDQVVDCVPTYRGDLMI